MRIWSVHPSILDRRGLVACWRETLLAQKVLRGCTKGYRNHPQLDRFYRQEDPVASVCAYLHGIADEADRRGYHFDRSRVVFGKEDARVPRIPVTRDQLAYELGLLTAKVRDRDEDWLKHMESGGTLLHDVEGAVRCHGLFFPVDGPIEPWEKVKPHG